VTEESTAALSDQQIAHLGMIQGVINRMASNSFALKALAVTIAASILAIAGAQQDAPASVSYVGLFPVVVFWLIDAKYLRLERLFRSLYDHIREGRDFEAFSMNTTSFNKDVSSTLRIAVSWSVIWFYLAVAAALVAVSCLPIILEKEFRS
jgi:hypothetical protein